MSSGALLLLLGFLTLWMELTPVSSDRPDYCYLPPDHSICRRFLRAYYYNPRRCTCVQFHYGGCNVNNNHFRSIGDCNRVCEGQ